ncbi:MAG: leucyl/phenylalanyl-tRNA--protein transferase [Psychromonas sp.]|jgi:leucyl/phenylalanyl-tRNA--protein transferase|uniref:leucyl/phenylalanyl-tRNA--protein transferase n=1 Tax=Psychromonas sp. TaxID=1884585 RepID=UPI0039E6534E
MAIYLPELSDNNTLFPDINKALDNPDGLLAMGGDLHPQRIINGYANGIFPWFSDGDPILWWSPSKRATIKPEFCHISASMKRVLKSQKFSVTVNSAFSEVITNCAAPRASQAETWITDTMIAAYIKLHQQGFAHSIEVWQEQKLVGGLYGVCIGTLFCGESMFSKVSNSSKIAFIVLNQHLQRFQGKLIDCQMQTAHLRSMGVEEVSRSQFITELVKYRAQNVSTGCWDTQEISVNDKMAKTS